MDPPNSLLEGTIRETISSNVEEEIQPYLPMLQQSGLGEGANLIVVKQTAKDIIFEHYCKTGKNEDITKEYAKNTLLPKFKSITEAVQRIFQEKKPLFPSPIAAVESFSSFAKLDFCNSGILDPAKFKEFALMDAAAQDFLIKTFEQHLKIQGELTTLFGQQMNLGMYGNKTETGKAETAGPSAEGKPAETKPEKTGAEKPAEAKSAIAALIEKGTPILKSKLQFTFHITTAEMYEKLKTAISAVLPANLEPANKDAVIDYLTAELKKLNPAPEETFEVSETGKWRKVDVQSEQAAREQAKQKVTAAQAAGAAPESIFSGIQKLFEGNNILGAIIGFILSLFGLKGFGGPKMLEADEFSTLSSADKADAISMKAAMEKLKLNMETLHPFFMGDPALIVKILKQRHNDKLSWEHYLEKYLASDEITILKNKQTMKPEQISAMLLSPKEQTDTAVATAQPAPAETATSQSPSETPAQTEATASETPSAENSPAETPAEQPASEAPEQPPQTPA
jgi:hypothetical protein